MSGTLLHPVTHGANPVMPSTDRLSETRSPPRATAPPNVGQASSFMVASMPRESDSPGCRSPVCCCREKDAFAEVWRLHVEMQARAAGRPTGVRAAIGQRPNSLCESGCMGELVEHVDAQDRVVGVMERGTAVRGQHLYRMSMVILRDSEDRYLVHQRPENSPRFPGSTAGWSPAP